MESFHIVAKRKHLKPEFQIINNLLFDLVL